MATFLPSGTELDGDRISQLPADVKDMIMECMDTRDAARVAVLSTQWKDIWLRHGRLVFDSCFFPRAIDRCRCNKPSTFVNMVTNVLMLRSGPVRKFEFLMTRLYLENVEMEMAVSWCKPKQSDVDGWCLFLSRNGIEQLTICVVNLTGQGYYELPHCIISCSTLKRLKLDGFLFYCPFNARLGSIFTHVTSLVFVTVGFIHNVNGSTIFSVPNLEELVFEDCQGIHNFVISAPKLKSLTVIFPGHIAEWKWFQLHFPVIKSLCLSLDALADIPDAALDLQEMFPTAINLQVMKLDDFSFGSAQHFSFASDLIKKCPKLCKLEIVSNQSCWIDDGARLLEDPVDGGFIIDHYLVMLKTVSIDSFFGYKREVLFVKAILSKSPVLEKLVILQFIEGDASVACKLRKEMCCFPRASPKVHIAFRYCIMPH
ncbi:unnamed protein product [Cuscuta epithymum]|uniref:FBD domain-containing protein n=2 Tax=Cuscuta epithymum TaxID=186058 RepID=A0AAV0DFW4_9ASTE|nr:unnamed protein product [Cuscuta epithymum]